MPSLLQSSLESRARFIDLYVALRPFALNLRELLLACDLHWPCLFSFARIIQPISSEHQQEDILGRSVAQDLRRGRTGPLPLLPALQ